MDRKIVYPGALPSDTDILTPQRNAMIALGFLAQAIMGTNTICDGLACTPTSPASLSFNIGPGCIFQNAVVDQTAYGSLAADTTDALLKVGINLTTTMLGPITAPGSAGQSQNWLVQAEMLEQDGGATVLPYYNASNPSSPYSGPNGTGTAQNTARTQTVNLQLKPGVAATTGTQTTPAPDSGFVGLWVITVANGQSTVTSGNITEYITAPFITTKLPQFRRRLTANLDLYVNGATGNDSNNGLSAISAFLTLQGAADFITKGLDLQGYTVTVHVADGNYAGVTIRGNTVGSIGSSGVVFLGNISTPDNCTVNAVNGSCFTAVGGSQFSVAGFKLTASGTAGGQGCGLASAGAGSLIAVTGNMDFASCAVADVEANNGGEVSVGYNFSVSGTSGRGFEAYQGGTIFVNNVTVTLTGTPSYTTAFANVDGPAAIAFALGITFSGSATGTRYIASNGGYIATGTGNTSLLPGNAAGSSTTGYYT